MSMIKLFDGTEIPIKSKQKEYIEAELAKSSDGFINVDGKTIKKNAIEMIDPLGYAGEGDFGNHDESLKKIEAGKRCRGQSSIQLEINKIAKDESGDNWPRLIRNNGWREQTRQQLRQIPDVDWCDYKANECDCGSGYLSSERRHDNDIQTI